MNPQVIYKTVNEKITFSIDLSSFTDLLATTIDSYTIEDFDTDTITTDIVVENITIGDTRKEIVCTVSGGKELSTYVIKILVGLENGNKIEVILFLVIRRAL